MTYVAEPYVQFVDDLLTALTGGEVRQRFVFLAEENAYPLATDDPLISSTVRVFGQARGAFRLFLPDRDYEVDAGEIQWNDPASGAVLPDVETAFYANFEVQRPPGTAPPLTDRHPGSITRLLAESFAREYAVLSGQLEGVYRAGFLDTATGRDLDELVKLVGVTRRSGAFAIGTAVFSRLSPAPAAIQIPAGTRLSTIEPPAVSFETTEDRVLRRGELSAEAPIVALVPGSTGVVPARVVGAIDLPILGIESVANPQPTRLAGGEESDEDLRRRARWALEWAGKATTGALLAALTRLPGLRDKDVRITQDHLAHPGVVKLNIVLPVKQPMSQDERDDFADRVAEQIEEVRPVGVRVLHHLNFADLPVTATSQPTVEGVLERPALVPAPESLLPVRVRVKVIPTAVGLRPAEQADLDRRVRLAVDAFFDEVGIGEPIVYNRLIAALMALDGVLDVAVDLGADPRGVTVEDAALVQFHHRANLFPADPGLRPVLSALHVEIAGQLVVLYVEAKITLKGAGTLGHPESDRKAALDEVATKLQEGIRTLSSGTILDRAVLQGFVSSLPNATVEIVGYRAEFIDAGVRLLKSDVPIPIREGETLWIGRVTLAGGAAG